MLEPQLTAMFGRARIPAARIWARCCSTHGVAAAAAASASFGALAAASWAPASQSRIARCHGAESAPVVPGGSPNALKGKVAVVTGAAGSMGRNISRALLSAGATVVLADRDLAKAEVIAKEFRDSVPGAKAVAGHVDVANEASVAALFAKIAKEQGSCDILVNSAGIMLPPTKTEDVSAADFSRLLSVNVTGGFICAKEAFKIMKKQKEGGRIVNIGSIASDSPRPDQVSYTVSKFAVAGLTKSLALDGRAHKIAVGAVHPGNVLSDLISPEDVAARKAAGEDFMDPMVVGNAVLHMCCLPANSTILEITVMPTVQKLVGRG